MSVSADVADLWQLAGMIEQNIDKTDLAALRASLLSIEDSRQAHTLETEIKLDRVALALRRHWLHAAHGSSDATMKAPSAERVSHLADGEAVSFGYERDLDASAIEKRGAAYAPAPGGWEQELVLFRSGQSALLALLHMAVGRWGMTRPLRLVHAGAYFETKALLALFPPGAIVASGPDEADVILLEPVSCDGQFASCSDSQFSTQARAVFFDTTLDGPTFDIAAWTAKARPDTALIVRFASALKLDQAGLEIANAGIAIVYSRCTGPVRAGAVADELRRIRSLTAGGVTLDELSTLSAPWFLDRTYAANYASAIFRNNAALASAIGAHSPIFAGASHPSLQGTGAAPFCALMMRDSSTERYDRLKQVIDAECRRRGVLLRQGGSFGFRGHRHDLITPEDGSPAFLRVALGWRTDRSCEQIVDLLGTIARSPAALSEVPLPRPTEPKL